MTTSPHPIHLIRRQATSSGQGAVLMQGCLELAPRVLPYSRRAARLLERIGLERPSLRLSGLLAELSVAGHKGIPAVLVDKLATALGEMLAGRPPPPQPGLPPALARLLDAVKDLERRTQGLEPHARPTPRVARLTLDENPPAFFYAEGRGLDAVPSGLAITLESVGAKPLELRPVRGPMLDVPSRLYAIERALDVILEPIADEGPRLLAMLVSGRVVRLALITGGGIRVTMKDDGLVEDVGLTRKDEDGGPGRYLVLDPARAREIVAALAARDDVTLAWASAQRLHTTRATLQQLRVRFGEKRDWLGMASGIEGGLDLDDGSAADLQAVLQALREGRRYVVVGKDRLAALTDELVEALEPLAAAAPVAPLMASLVEKGARVDGGEAWRRLREDLDRAKTVDGEPPAGLKAELRPYQKEGLRFLRRLAAWRTGGVLADDMGLGKTVQTIALLLERGGEGPALVVAPTSVCFNWREELARFAPGLRVVRYEGARRKLLLSSLRPNDVVVASYAVLQRDAADADAPIVKQRFATLVLDEAQQVKNATTRRARAVRNIGADFRVALSGTPLENHTGELWAIFDAVAPGLFGTWNDFKARFAQPIEKEADRRRRRTLARAIRPFVLRRKKKDVAPELPPRVEVVKHLPLEPAEKRAYDRVRQALLIDLLREGDDPDLPAGERRVRLLAAITRLRLIACHPAFAGDTLDAPDKMEPASKQRALVELLLELKESGHKALVFSQFVRHLEIARAAATAAGITSLQLDGSTPADERQALVERFQAGEVDAFFLSLKAGGTGLNLVRASYVVHLDPWWNPAVEDQATDRAHRIGQTEPVTVVRLVAEGTLEEEMLELHEHKRALVEGVLEGTGAAASLSVDELVGILRHTRTSTRHEAQELADGDG